MVKKIRKLIITGNFFEAKKQLTNIKQEHLRDILLTIGYDDNNICAYSFICFLILEHETTEYHSLASEILIHSFPQIGGYAAALFHVRRSLQLDPDNIEILEMLLFFNDIPEKLVMDEEAKIVAAKVIKKKTESIPAREVLSKDTK